MRVSNEPCTDRPSNARRELAHERAVDGLDVYGECRDNEQKAKRLRPNRIHSSSKNCNICCSAVLPETGLYVRGSSIRRAYAKTH